MFFKAVKKDLMSRQPVIIAITGDGAKALPQGIAVSDAAGKVALLIPLSN